MPRHLTALEQTRIRTLYTDGGFTIPQICQRTPFTKGQVNRALFSPSGPRRRKGPPPALSAADEAELVEFITASQQNRLMPWYKISILLFDGKYGTKAIRSAMQRLGYKRYAARLKPPLSPANRAKRLAFAEAHVDWTPEQWANILWSDETWMTYGYHTKQYVTRLPGEEYEDTCVVNKIQRKRGWMFWGSFSGYGKGPGIFWEKKWGFINQASYCEHIIPVVHDWIQQNEANGVRLTYMQDNAPGHRAKGTVDELATRGIQTLQWPPLSPDLNPIETVWNWMKDYIQEHYGHIANPKYEVLRAWVTEAWNAVPELFLTQLLEDMQRRCKEVIQAEGGYTAN
ncbi:hypothetical protein EKO27_g5442 [Xylaria grammica]|uniref:Tc1-like transposase DDE domain-containing protein n=1 Tax=Xylaria grammica TaxID=363999 RepID=A0A439D5G3_9PEZI|nr:hypothetical protein EKO27_g5442 [Xylaria grammica]